MGKFKTSQSLAQQKMVALPTTLALLLSLALILAITLSQVGVVSAAGTLTVEIIAGYNLVVDSNVESPSTYAPSVATVMGRFCNPGDAPLTGVQGYIGDFGAGTPGIYPARTVDAAFVAEHPSLTNAPGSTYAFSHVGGRIGTADATRFMGTLEPGECKVQYWHLHYPQCENNPDGSEDIPACEPGNSPTWGDSIKPDDDLWLTLDVWGTSAEGSNNNASWTMHTRNEISAAANKIQPNPDGRWFNTKTSEVAPGDVITSNGVHYEFGTIRFGFDNDNDFLPDYNAWAQPIGDPSYDPSCFRLIRTTGLVTVTRGSGLPDLILPFDDRNPPDSQ